MAEYDVVIIGAGAVGCAVAKLLSEYEIRIAVVEKEADVAFGTSGRNSAVVHAGFNNEPGSLKAKLCVEGNRGFEKLAEQLGVKYMKTGKYVTGFSDNDREELERLKLRGEANGVTGLEIVDGDKVRELFPNVKGNFALWSPDTAIFDPFEYTVKLAESACSGGAEFIFSSKVTAVEKDRKGLFSVCYESLSSKIEEKDTGCISAKVVVNCAGLYSADICRLAGVDRFEIKPCRGEYHILDKRFSEMAGLPVYPLPDKSKGVLGVHLTPTVSGNIMIGPSAEFIDEKDDFGNKEEIMELLKEGAELLMPELKDASVIRSFSGIRPKLIDRREEIKGDFVIEKSKECPGFIYLVGIESPGITASMPIAKMVLPLVEEEFRKKLLKKSQIIIKDNDICEGYDLPSMVCRCEKVTEGEILKAYDDIVKLGAFPTMKGIKNRTRAGMGSCQGSFCTVDIAEILRHRRGVELSEITYDGIGSEFFYGNLK